MISAIKTSRMCIIAFSSLLLLILSCEFIDKSAAAQASNSQQRARSINDVGSWSDILRQQIGRNLFEGMKSVFDNSNLILHQFSGSQVVFSSSSDRILGEELPSIERRSPYAIVLSACPRSNSPTSRIVAVSLELKLHQDPSGAPELLRRLLEAAYRRDSSPITARPPRPNDVGVVMVRNDQNRREELFGFFRPQSRPGSLDAAITSVIWSYRDESLC